jgi:hypothetical protein
MHCRLAGEIPAMARRRAGRRRRQQGSGSGGVGDLFSNSKS